MLARISLLLPLLLSLLLAAPMRSETREVVSRDPGACVGAVCVKVCCTSKACCDGARQQQAPKVPAPLAAQPEWQLAVVSFQDFSPAAVRPPVSRNFITVDEKSAQHSLPPLAQSCIQLI